ncbi:hypothetical protein R83H12_00940 [Fibrobacteria bacterium R8-3-H12]
MDYESDMKRFSDHANALAYAKEKGVVIGEARGERRGVVIGKKQGVGIGLKRAAKNMLADGLDPERVARITNLSKRQIMALR